MGVSRQELEVRSYHIWEREGRPQGRDWEHWFRAEAELNREGAPAKKAAASAQARKPRAKKAGTAKKAAAKKS